MRKTMNKYKPAVDKWVLLLLAGFMWIGVGIMLLTFAYSWLRALHGVKYFIFAVTGIVVALMIHHFGFLKIVDNNLGRILPMEGKRCIFSFITWKSYIIVAIMIAMGTMLRHSPIPKSYLSVVYTGIGLSLILSSVRYIRVLVFQIKK
jgi:hypothetical protein